MNFIRRKHKLLGFQKHEVFKMATASLPEPKEKLALQAVVSKYPDIGTTYSREGYDIGYSEKLAITDMNYYDSKAEIPQGFRMSTAAEELAMQLEIERRGKDPSKAGIFAGLFGRGPENTYVWQWTDTGLRVPKGWENGRYDKSGKRYPRIVLIGNKEVGEVLVPESGYVQEWDEVFGVPKTTSNLAIDSLYKTYFSFLDKPYMDSKSGHHDIAVGRSAMNDYDKIHCLKIDAHVTRLDHASSLRIGKNSTNGFRLVSGPEAKIDKNLAQKEAPETPAEEIERAFLEKIKADYRSMSFPDFLKKYEL